MPARLRAVLPAVAAAAVIAALFGGAATAQRASAVAAAVPGRPTFPATIDPFPQYERENGCSATAKPGAVELQRILKVTYGASIASNIVRACTSRSSGHEEGRSIDWMVSERRAEQRAMGDAFVGWLVAPDEFGNARATARRLGVQYVIWKSRILSFSGPTAAWREYEGCLTKRTARADDTYCHRDHVHLSLTWAGARKQTTWYTLAGLPACTEASLVRTIRSTAAPRAAVGVTATTLLDTAAGIGTPRLAVPCRLPSDGSLRVRTAGIAGVPATGVAQVHLRVTATAAGLPTTVLPKDPVIGASPSAVSGRTRTGVPDRAALVLQPGRSLTASWWVRVDDRGEASLLVGRAVERVAVSVVGYRLAGADPRAVAPVPGSDGSATTPVGLGSRHAP